MNENFIKSLYESIVKENLELERELYEATKIGPKIDEYWKSAIGLYNSLTEENKDILMRIIEQTMIDTISNMLGIIDGSSTLNGCSLEPKLLLDSNDTEGELQDLFLEFIEKRANNN
ncbi:transposase [Cytobacillus horneckiae]|uniref:Transposase n=1 Tax=Cytobacillus horneckiae TaxID=549687 RepID=A0A2N0Z963_9BACI|nr:transposase [Cytobacillus horneckiae]MEC1155455.1 transposase [Cytobacillus horneckiae]MED2940504.1 transposase [Cytobacillus horneckiae]PKG26030.1 transposase [Cytobacillus horneckiae]